MTAPKAKADGRWQVLHAKRGQHLARARQCSALTLPAILPPESSDENTPLPTPWQTMGARCVNNLSSKIVLTLMPTTAPCMRFVINEQLAATLKQRMGEDTYATDVESKLAARERQVQQWMEAAKIRVPSFRIMRLLIVTGNALMYRHKSKSLKVYRLDQYVVRRNGQGQVVELVVKEKTSTNALPSSIIAENVSVKTGAEKDTTDLFTYCYKRGDKWFIRQEAMGKVVPGTQGKYTDEDMPFNVLIWSLADGEDYGRGHVEEHLGDFIALESLTQSLVEAAAANAKLIFMVNPNGVTAKRDLIDAKNGGFVAGVADDVSVLQVDKAADLSIVAQEIQVLKDSLSFAFLMHTAVQRKGERVTAEEIRFMAQDIEDGLGGIYSILAQEYQLPLVQWAITTMSISGELEKLPEGITVAITTGLEALGRNHDLDKIGKFLQHVSFIPAEILIKRVNITGLLKRVATAVNLDTSGIIYTEAQVQEQEAKEKQEVAQLQAVETATNSGVAREVARGSMSNTQQQ